MENRAKTVREIQPTRPSANAERSARPLRVAAYCRVSTDSDEQEMSFDAQCKYYTDRIMTNPKWTLAGIFADEGISGTNAGRRKEFMKMIRLCRQKKIDLVITKSVSRFARNTVDCLMFVRELKALGIPVIFEKEGLNTMDSASEIYISMHGVFAQSESESLSGNVRMGKAFAAKNGKVTFSYKNFLGYRRGEDGKPEIDPEQAEIVRFIYDRFLAGDSLLELKRHLEANGFPSPSGKALWSVATIRSILTNEKYKGDALLQKTYVVDCISHRVKKNDDRPQYYVENSHPAIIPREKFDRVQVELARRASKRKTKEVGTRTESGKYSSKYALSELLFCGCCGKPYRRCTWSRNGQKRIVWRCVSRLDYGTKYCKNSPTIDEAPLQNAIAQAIAEFVEEHGVSPAENLQSHVSMYYGQGDENSTAAEELRRQELAQAIMDAAGNEDSETLDALISELNRVKATIAEKQARQAQAEQASGKADEIIEVIESLKGMPVVYDDQITRQLVASIQVIDKDEIDIIFYNAGNEPARIVVQ